MDGTGRGCYWTFFVHNFKSSYSSYETHKSSTLRLKWHVACISGQLEGATSYWLFFLFCFTFPCVHFCFGESFSKYRIFTQEFVLGRTLAETSSFPKINTALSKGIDGWYGPNKYLCNKYWSLDLPCCFFGSVWIFAQEFLSNPNTSIIFIICKIPAHFSYLNLFVTLQCKLPEFL